ncbi:MAG: replication-relaxation family protein [Chloroflexota bacterium]|nr:replication-relaxation family protein [Chloroflexota bacterium]
MSGETCEGALLRQLAETPLADRLELAALSGWSHGAAYTAAARLEGAGLAASLPLASDLIPPARRFLLTDAGLQRLASMAGVSVGEMLRTRPVSRHWRHLLLERLDVIAAIYRLATALASCAHPLRVRWYRAAPLDAAVAVPGGPVVGVVRQGLASDRTGFSRRLRRLFEGPLPGILLLLLPDELRLRHARRLLGGAPLTAFLALEREVVLAGASDRIWRLPSLPGRITLAEVVRLGAQRGIAPVETPPLRAALPGDAIPEHLLAPSRLKPAEKRALDLLLDWPWLVLDDLAGLLAVSRARASRLVLRLEALELAARISVSGRPRLVLTDRGLAVIAHRDRVSAGALRKRWSAAAVEPEEPLAWRNVRGSRSRQLLRHLTHTTAVHGFVAALVRQARACGWEVAQIDPPHRASRYFRQGEGLHSVRPDAFALLRRGGSVWPFFLEWERRAVRPTTMAGRLAPYLRYYATSRPADDHGVQPAVLVVLQDDLAASHFLRVARAEMERTGVQVPLRVSHGDVLEEQGPLGRAWRTTAEGALMPPPDAPFPAHEGARP